ncbi:MAG: hypothetical protein AAGB93_10300 [Planctomycetota bacterium]
MSYVLLAVALLAPPQTSAPAVSSVDPETPYLPHVLVHSLEKGFVGVELSNDGVRGRAEYFFYGRNITVRWTYAVPGYTGGIIPRDSSLVTCNQVFATTYRPTEVACVDVNKVLVAGLSRDGRNVVEEWTFEDVEVPPVTYRYPSNGAQVPPRLKVDVVSKRLVYTSPNPGGSYVGAIYRNWAAPTRPFLLEVERKELLQLDLEKLTHVVVATEDGRAGLAVPGLAALEPESGFDFVKSGRLARDVGAAYWLGSSFNGGPDVLVFADSDLDGLLDETYTLDDEGWGASPLSSATNYVGSRGQSWAR